LCSLLSAQAEPYSIKYRTDHCKFPEAYLNWNEHCCILLVDKYNKICIGHAVQACRYEGCIHVLYDSVLLIPINVTQELALEELCNVFTLQTANTHLPAPLPSQPWGLLPVVVPGNQITCIYLPHCPPNLGGCCKWLCLVIVL